ncbi:MAG TPA: TetR family transcriptional regulator [Vicinamibacterales bacterium]
MSSKTSAGRILDAALTLIGRKGDASVTMAQIAKAARVSRQAVYLHFADRAALMVALARHLDERLGLPADIQKMMDAPSGTEMLQAAVSIQARRNLSVWAVARALDAVRRTDKAAERAWQDRLNSRLDGCRAIVARLQAEGDLRAGIDQRGAVDLLWTITSLRVWEDLVLGRGWSAQQYQEQITRLLLEALTQQ